MYKFLVIELQTDSDGNVAHLVTKHDALNAAESKWHTVLAYAATSGLPMHAASLIRSDGALLRHEFYEVLPEPEEPVDNPSPTLGGAE